MSLVAVGPGDAQVYAAVATANGIVVFDRDSVTGVLTQQAGAAGCVTESGSGGCADGVALMSPSDIEFSPDGAHAYVVSLGSDAIAVVDRDTVTGVLTQKAGTNGCVSNDGTGGSCALGTQMHLPSEAAISPDGRNLYLVSGLTASDCRAGWRLGIRRRRGSREGTNPSGRRLLADRAAPASGAAR